MSCTFLAQYAGVKRSYALMLEDEERTGVHHSVVVRFRFDIRCENWRNVLRVHPELFAATAALPGHMMMERGATSSSSSSSSSLLVLEHGDGPYGASSALSSSSSPFTAVAAAAAAARGTSGALPPLFLGSARPAGQQHSAFDWLDFAWISTREVADTVFTVVDEYKQGCGWMVSKPDLLENACAAVSCSISLLCFVLFCFVLFSPPHHSFHVSSPPACMCGGTPSPT